MSLLKGREKGRKALGFDIQCGEYKSTGGKEGHSNKDPQETYKRVSFCEYYTCRGERAVRYWFTERTTKCNFLSVFKGIAHYLWGRMKSSRPACSHGGADCRSARYANPFPAGSVSELGGPKEQGGAEPGEGGNPCWKACCKWLGVVQPLTPCSFRYLQESQTLDYGLCCYCHFAPVLLYFWLLESFCSWGCDADVAEHWADTFSIYSLASCELLY